MIAKGSSRTHTRQAIRAHRHEGGMTLIELLVSIAVLAVIGSVISVVFDAGIKALGTGGAGDRITGVHDISIIEQQLSADVTRASCISTAPFLPATRYGRCGNAIPGPPVPASAPFNCSSGSPAYLCVAWPTLLNAAGTASCHVAIYTFNEPAATRPNTLTRREYVRASSGGAWTAAATTRASFGSVLAPTPSPAIGTVANGYSWPRQIQVSVTSTQVKLSQPSGTYVVQPLSDDPAATVGYSAC
jgi:prepilin-type N-terminal cleavage/methylation domain-containing protein